MLAHLLVVALLRRAAAAVAGHQRQVLAVTAVAVLVQHQV
jgi:hypothetical protein